MMFVTDVVNTLSPSSPSIPTQLSAAMACGYILNAIRKWDQIPWINQHVAWTSAIARAIMSAATTLGISWSWSSANHTLTISGLTATTIMLGMYHWLSQYACQHGFEQLLQVRQTQAGAIVKPQQNDPPSPAKA